MRRCQHATLPVGFPLRISWLMIGFFSPAFLDYLFLPPCHRRNSHLPACCFGLCHSTSGRTAELKGSIARQDAVVITDSAEEDKLKRILWSKIEGLFAKASHTHSASDINSGTLSSSRLPTIPANKGGTGQTTLTPSVTTKGVRQIYAGTSDMTAGSSSLTTGCIYLVYE